MKKILAEELDRAIHEPRTWIVMLLSLGFFAYGFSRAYRSAWVPPGYSFADLWYFVYSGSYFPYFIPLAAALPFADSLVIDRMQGYLRYLVARGRYLDYLKAKFIVNALVGAGVILFPLIVLYLFANLAAPRSIFLPNTWQPSIAGRPEDIWVPLFRSSPDGFIATVTLLAAMVGALYATLGLAASLVVSNRYLALGAPFVIFVLADFVAQRTNLFGPAWSPLAAVAGISPAQAMSASAAGLFLNPLSVLLLCGALVVFFGQRRRILQ